MRWQIPLVLVGLLAIPAWAQAQTYPSMQYPTSQYPTSQYPSTHYPTQRYPSSAPPASRTLNPAVAAAQRQSGLSADQVQTLLQSKGYSWINSVDADPNSIWIWQAEATKDGRPVRVGVDYRGNVLVIAPEANRPCTSPGVNYGVGGLGVGTQLSIASSCNR
jgi:hypothetical protein